jgi:hypothetical protein
MKRAAVLALAVVVLAHASAGAGTPRPPAALTATPAHISITGSGRATVRVANPGSSPLVVEVGRAGFSLDLRGRPRIVAREAARAATSWLSVQPGRFVLAAGASRVLAVSSRLPARTEPGDHDALVLLTTRPRRSAGVAVRMRIGVVVVVRAPGRIVRRLVVGRLRVRRAHGSRILELSVANRGNVTETLARDGVRVSLLRRGRRTTVSAESRDLRPRTSGVVQFRYHGRLSGWTTARVEIAPLEGGREVRRSFRVKL